MEPDARKETVHDFPVNVGLIFRKGELAGVPSGRLVDDRGRSVPFEAEATGWWDADHQHVRWLLVRLRASTDRTYFFEPWLRPPLRPRLDNAFVLERYSPYNLVPTLT